MGMNSAGETSARPGGCQRISASTPMMSPPLHHVLRLVVKGQLLLVEGAAQLVVDEQPAIRLQLHGGIEEASGLATGRLGLIHGGVRLLEQIVHPLLPAGEEGDADAGADMQHLARMVVGGPQSR